ncbi:EamA family transporter RarD [Halostreptopolyspora alba]|uniref:EamA family transporter RarD n=1 Tax=Halostreptopolyspora alba TaxID=2487137 RepID=A0A3N0E2L6_9ACTN|nr:EamA family transporter RarD [Nocardiopsaceae bacterium YIM 96095]
MSDSTKGLLIGASSYVLWGLSTLYWPLLSSSGPIEILAHRMVWSLVGMLLVLLVMRHWQWLVGLARSPRQLLLVAGAATVISANWGIFIYTVNSGNALQASLGYFINPLVSVVFGVIIFSERLRPLQWVAVALGTLAVVVLTFDYGAPPWLALGLALCFALYGVFKKFVRLDGLESLTSETLLMLLPALGYLLVLHAMGTGTFGQTSPAHTLLLVGTGAVTALPLLCFGFAVVRLPLSMLGLLQFIVPVMQFFIAWQVFGEQLPLSRWIGFAIVWVALVVFGTDLVRNARDRATARRAAGETADPEPERR